MICITALKIVLLVHHLSHVSLVIPVSSSLGPTFSKPFCSSGTKTSLPCRIVSKKVGGRRSILQFFARLMISFESSLLEHVWQKWTVASGSPSSRQALQLSQCGYCRSIEVASILTGTDTVVDIVEINLNIFLVILIINSFLGF